MSKLPLDDYEYDQDPNSCPISPKLSDGDYVYVRDLDGAVWVLPDGPHQHVKVLGGGKPALYAGDLTIENGFVTDLTNISGTFEFDDAEGLLAVAKALESTELQVLAGAVRLFSFRVPARPRVLR